YLAWRIITAITARIIITASGRGTARRGRCCVPWPCTATDTGPPPDAHALWARRARRWPTQYPTDCPGRSPARSPSLRVERAGPLDEGQRLHAAGDRFVERFFGVDLRGGGQRHPLRGVHRRELEAFFVAALSEAVERLVG